MSDKVIQFTKVKVLMPVLSLIVIIAGLAGIGINGGFNLGIDFLSGINMRLQVAENVLRVAYDGSDRAVMNISEGILQISLIREGGLIKEDKVFPLSDYTAVSDLADAVASVEGIRIEKSGNVALPAGSVLGLNYETDLTLEGVVLNSINTVQEKFIGIADIREQLAPLGNVQIQTVGKPLNQEFIIRIQDRDEERDFNVKAAASVVSLLEKKYGTSNIVVKQTDYVGPKFSQAIGYQSVSLTSFALLLILVYIWFRFKLAYAVSAVAALLHDVLVMIGVIATFRLEVNTATIAAVLTIIGYSLNDTIVIFDRIRENQNLLRDRDFERVVNISITQSLSRTLITSLTTLLAVIAIYFFGTGMIKLFALNLIVGVTVGTYSSIFIASPILIAWVNAVKKRNVTAAGKSAEKQVQESSPEPAVRIPEEQNGEPEKTKQAPALQQRKYTRRKVTRK